MAGTVPVITNPTPPGGQLFGSEVGLPQGSNPGGASTSSSWTFTIKAEDGVRDLTIGGYTAIQGGVFTPGSVTLPYGRLSVTSYDPANGAVGVAFNLTAPIQSSLGTEQKYGDIRSFQVVLTDADGDAAHSTLLVQIRDDEKLSLSSDSANVTVGGSVSGNLVTGGAPDKFSADGFGQVVQISGRDWSNADTSLDAQGRLSIAGQYGVLTVAPNGNYSYAANADAPAGATDGFSYWATDGDGDRASAGLTITLQAGSQPPPSTGGQVITSPGPGSTVTGGAGNDTLVASQGADVLTGNGGGDAFTFKALPWSAGKVTDFVVGTDRLDLSAIFQSSGYTGSDPMADGRLTLQSDGAGGTKVFFDRDAPNAGDWPFHITTLQGVSPTGLTWAKLSGGTADPAPAGPTFSVAPTSISQSEGNGDGVTEYLFTVTRNGSTAGPVSVDYTSAGVGPNPASPDDFWSTGGVLHFADGQTSATALVRVKGDAAAEANETFQLTLLNVTTSGSPATGTIVNDDTTQPPPSSDGQVITSPGPGSSVTGGAGNDTLIASQGADVLTGNGGGDAFTFNALPWNAGRITDFAVGTDRLDLKAIFQSSGYNGSDPIADGRVTLQSDGSGGTKVFFDRDAPNAGDWPFHITTLQGVSPAGLTWAKLSGGGSNPPTAGGSTVGFSSTGFTVVEGNAGFQRLAVATVTRSSGEGSASVDWRLAPSGATPVDSADFMGSTMPGSGIVNFAAGETSKQIAVTINGDTTAEADETFTLTLSNAQNAALGTSSTVVTLLNDDGSQPPPSTSGQVLRSDQYGDTLAGGAGNDTLIAGQGPDRLTGAGGADHFVYEKLPWSRGEIADFTPGQDLLDLSALAPGYSGSNPIRDGYLEFRDVGGATQVMVDADGPGGDWPTTVTLLRGVSPSQLGAGDWIF
ncbi:Calx-beta domain-containing protein [Phenylobacterium sp.]|jgi:Ca2+-binding RTX toxin-like protein|uniref:Calx-beta domain-containing protein n=1 Tax=Phenylobacterium sp. TaxID=1871053 RepID=UPI002F91CD80